MSANSEDRECPLCLEALELDDLNFFPCACGYQICRFCWHRIRTNENGLCPACRKQYSEDPANFKPLTVEELHRIKNEKKQKDLQRKQKLSENRKHLANVRVVQKNLVFVVGLPARLADAEELKKPSYFGKFGKIVKVIVNHSTSYAGSQGPSASAYVTYQRFEDALRAIQAVNNSKVDGRTLKASLGTTKYCSNFLKKQQCPKQDCMYLHELGDEAASFTKEEMQAGLHQEYENKLHEQMLSSGDNSIRKQPSPVENGNSSAVTTQVFHRERWPSPKRDRSNTPNSSTGPSQFKNAVSNLRSEASPESERAKDRHEGNFRFPAEEGHQSAEMLSVPSHKAVENGGLQGLCTLEKTEPVNSMTWHNSSRDLPPYRLQEPYQQSTNHAQMQPKLVSFENHFSLGPSEMTGSEQMHSILNRCQTTNSEQSDLRPSAVHNGGMTNGLSHGVLHKSLHPSYNWPNGQSKEFLKSIFSETVHSSSSDFPGFVNSSPVIKTSTLFGSRNVPLNMYSGIQSLQDGISHVQNGMRMFAHNNVKNMYSSGENSSLNSQDDDLGFDPWHESSKGLADLMLKEADEKARANGMVLNRASNARRTATAPSELAFCRTTHPVEFPRYAQRQTVPPPGFSVHSYGANAVPRPLLTDAFSNKTLPVMNMYNHSQSAQVTTHYQQQNMPLQTGGAFSQLLNSREAEMRPQVYDWQESNFTNLQHKNLELGYNSLSHNLPNHMGRFSSSSWSNATLAELIWQQQQQQQQQQHQQHEAAISQGRNMSPVQVEKMLQQLKLNEQSGRFQNHTKYTPFSTYKGGSS